MEKGQRDAQKNMATPNIYIFFHSIVSNQRSQHFCRGELLTAEENSCERHLHPTLALTSNRARSILIQSRKRLSRFSYTGVGARKASWLSSMSRAFSSFAIASGFISLLMYGVVTPNFSEVLLLCLPPWTSVMSCHRCVLVSLFLSWSDPGFVFLAFLAAVPAAALVPAPATASRRFASPPVRCSLPPAGCVVLLGITYGVLRSWQVLDFTTGVIQLRD